MTAPLSESDRLYRSVPNRGKKNPAENGKAFCRIRSIKGFSVKKPVYAFTISSIFVVLSPNSLTEGTFKVKKQALSLRTSLLGKCPDLYLRQLSTHTESKSEW